MREVFLLLATTLAVSANLQPITDFFECQEGSCTDACDTSWLKFSAETPATTAAPTDTPKTELVQTTPTQKTTAATVAATTTAAPTRKPTPPHVNDPNNRCPDQTYQVPLLRFFIYTAGTPSYNFVPSDRMALATKQGFTLAANANYTCGCIISLDKLAVAENKCPEVTGCLAPLCHTMFRDNGRLQYRLRTGVMPATCPPGGTIVGYVITKYDCCGAIAPVNELWRTPESGYPPDFWTEIGDGNGQWPKEPLYKYWKSVGLPFFSWPVISQTNVEVCPDRKYMAPIVRTWGHFGAYTTNYFYYYFLMDDTSDYEKDQKDGDIRIQWMWRTGCAVKKDGLKDLELACPGYKECVKPLCSTRAKHHIRTNLPVYRLETADWTEPLCSSGKHIGYIPTTPGCCEANALLQTMVRSTPVPGYFYSPVSADIFQEGGWTFTKLKDFYVWSTIPLLH